MALLQYGTDSSVCLEFPAGVQLQECGKPIGTPLADPMAAVRAATEAPIDYPPFAQIATPGDRIAIALGRGLPRVAEITAGMLRALVAAGVQPDGITVLRPTDDKADVRENPCKLLQGILRDRIQLATHDATDRKKLAYLAATTEGEPIMLNRLLTDADVVLPIGCMQRENTRGYFGIQTAIFPDLSDQKNQARFRRLDAFHFDRRHHVELKQEAEHIAWLLGVNVTVQIVPGEGDDILHVVAGQTDAVRRHGRELYRSARASTVSSQANLVVAEIRGGPQQQTWENLGRVVETAGRLVEDDGAIAICCDLATPPGPALQRMVGAPSRDDAEREIRHDVPIDTVPALQIMRALDRTHVYLLSRLDASDVEELGMIPVEDPADIARLAARSRSCTVLHNGARAMVSIEVE